MKTIRQTIVSNSIIAPIATAAMILSASHRVVAQATVDTWTGSGDGTSWNSAANWTGGNPTPENGDSLLFNGSYGTGNGTLNDNLGGALATDGINITGGSYTFNTGNSSSLLLSGQTNLNTIGVANGTGTTQTFGTLPLALDWGYYTFSSPSGGTIALNSGLTLNTQGSVAYFDANNTSTSLMPDSTGLISGLGGAAMIYNPSGTANPFTGLATISSGAISALSTFGQTISGGATIGVTTASSAQNVEITDSGTSAVNYTLTGGSGTTYFNTILLPNELPSASADFVTVGSAAGAQTIVMGAVSGIGGFYVPPVGNANSAKQLEIGSGSSTILTAGTTSAGGTIVLAINGNDNNVAIESSAVGYNLQLNTSIANNSAGGPVALVKVGNGIARLTTLSSYTGINYSGGTYVLQGVYTGGAPGAFGTGPIYVASGATLFLNNGGTYTNVIYLSPGQGYSYNSSDLEPGVFFGALAFNATETFTNTLILQGPATSYNASTGPTAANPGDRVAGTGTSISGTFTGQITGPGTLELNGAHSWTAILDNTAAAPNTNNFQGGVIIDPLATHAINIDLQMGANNQLAGGNVTMVAPDAGSGDSARFDLHGTSQTIGALIGTGLAQGYNVLTNSTASSSAILTLGANNATGDYQGGAYDTTSGTLGFVKIGTGSQTFDNTGNGTFNYHGNTTVNAGSLALYGGGGSAVTLPNTPVITIAPAGTFDISQDLSTFTVGSSQVLNCTGTINAQGNAVAVSGTIEATNASGPGALTENGGAVGMQLNNGGTYVWAVSNFTGAAGSSSGWSTLNTGGQLAINVSGGNQFTINITSLGSSATNFNPNVAGSWIIATATGGITGYTGASQFAVVTTSFVNAPTSSSQWSVSTSGNNLVLNYTPFQVLTTPLPANALSRNQGQTATFTVTANSLGTSPTFAWSEGGNPLVNSGSSAGGGSVTIVTNGFSSTLTIAGVDQSSPPNDNSSITVNATEMYNSTLQLGSSSESLIVTDAPTGVTLTPGFQPSLPSYQGAGVLLTAQASGGNFPLSYQWFLNGNAIGGATDLSYMADISSTNYNGTYTVEAYDSAGTVTSTSYTLTANPPISSVPNQLIFEPFNYPGANFSPGFDPAREGPVGNGMSWNALNELNVYNQQTGVPLQWVETGVNLDFRVRAPNEMVDPLTCGPSYNTSTQPQSLTTPLDEYPCPGLASGYTWQGPNSPLQGATNGIPFGNWGWGYNPENSDTNYYVDYGVVGADPVTYTSTDHNGNQVNLPLGQTITNGTLYCSMVVINSGLNANGTNHDYYCGFGNGATNGTTIWGGLFLTNLAGAAPIPYQIGIFKGNLAPTGLNAGVNGDWDTNITCAAGHIYFLVMRLNINPSGGSTCDLWIDPATSSYYASEANVPTPDVQGVGGSAADVAGGVSFFYMKATTYPVSRDWTDLRIGTTWASVTPPSAPTLTVNSAQLTPCTPATPVVFTVQNAGNQVTGNYVWTFNHGAAPVTLATGTQANPADPSDGATFTVSGPSNQVLTVSNATGAEVGTYVVSGSNISPAPSDNTDAAQSEFLGVGSQAVTLTGSATATLSFMQPALGIAYAPGVTPSIVLSWLTSTPSCYSLQQTTSLSQEAWTAVSGSVVVNGAYNTVTISPAPSVPTYYELKASP